MEQRSLFLGTTIILLITLASAVGYYSAVFSVGLPAPIYGQDETSDKNVLIVSGNGFATADPDRVKLQLAVVTEAVTADLASSDNADQFNAVLTTLLDEGIPREQIETVQYSIYPVYDYSERTRTLIGYRVYHGVSVTIISGENDELGVVAGNLIDLVVESGVNQITGIQFDISEETTVVMRNEALQNAVVDARTKADTLAESLDVTIVGIHQVTESSHTPTPPIFRDAVAEDGSSSTELVPGELKTTASVQITYLISQ